MSLGYVHQARFDLEEMVAFALYKEGYRIESGYAVFMPAAKISEDINSVTTNTLPEFPEYMGMGDAPIIHGHIDAEGGVWAGQGYRFRYPKTAQRFAAKHGVDVLIVEKQIEGI